MARFLMIAYTTYMHDGRVKRHAEALAERGDHVDVICLDTDEQPITNGVNVIGLPMRRYRGESKSAYLRSYMRFFSMAAQRAARSAGLTPAGRGSSRALCRPLATASLVILCSPLASGAL